jgi:hypothetical protein
MERIRVQSTAKRFSAEMRLRLRLRHRQPRRSVKPPFLVGHHFSGAFTSLRLQM